MILSFFFRSRRSTRRPMEYSLHDRHVENKQNDDDVDVEEEEEEEEEEGEEDAFTRRRSGREKK